MRKSKLNNKGEAYIEICVAVLCFSFFICVMLRIFTLVSERTQMEQACLNILDIASSEGSVSCEKLSEITALYSAEKGYLINIGSDSLSVFSGTPDCVQLGEKITVSVGLRVPGLIPGFSSKEKTLWVTRYGNSEKYWK